MFEYDTLSLDIGIKRIGMAAGNSESEKINILKTVDRAQNRGLREILNFLQKHQIKTLVVGIALDERGLSTSESEKIEKFVERIKKRYPVNVVFVDEWGSSEDAKQRLRLAANPEKKLRESGIIDGQAASIILERYFQLLSEL